MKIYTHRYNPFHMGGPQHDVIATEVGEYERISVGKGYFGLLVKNPVKSLYHMAEEKSGALIGTHKSKAKLIKQVKQDVKDGTKKMMEEQIKQGLIEAKSAQLIPSEDFFKSFKEEK